MLPSPSLKRSANSRPPGPVWRYAVHFRHIGSEEFEYAFASVEKLLEDFKADVERWEQS